MTNYVYYGELAWCHHCHPEQFPPEFGAPGRTSPAHFSVRFEPDPTVLQIFLDDEKLRDCVECMAGDTGWAVCQPFSLLTVHTIGCPRSIDNMESYLIRRGRVRVECMVRW